MTTPTAREHRIPHLGCLLTATQELQSAPDLEAGLLGVAHCLRDVVAYDNIAILLLDRNGRELLPAMARGYPQGFTEHWRFSLGHGIVGRVAESGQVLTSDNVTKDPRYLEAAPGTRSEVAVPLLAKGRVMGVLDLGRMEPVAFDEEERSILQLLAGSLASAIDSQRLYDNVRRQARTLSILHELSRELTSILDRQQVLERVAERLRSHLDYDVLTIHLWNEERELLEPWIAVHDRRVLDRVASMPLGVGITGSAAALRQTLRIPNVCIDPRYVECNHEIEVRSELAVPLIFQDRLVGVLDLESSRYDAFTLEHELLLSTLGSSLAIAIENARLYERANQRQRELDRDLSTARKIQRQLLPASTPWVPGLQIAVAGDTARHLGGDLYDFLPYPGGRMGIALGDVSGKATAAALLASLTIGTLRELAPREEPCPGELLGQLNARVHDLDVRRRFVALAYAVFDPARRTVSLANAGLPYPLLVRDGEVSELQLNGVPLGGLARSTYAQETVALGPGDTLVMLTDGLTEATDRHDRELESAGVIEIVRRLANEPTRNLADGLLAAVCDYAEGSVRSDDRTVVVLRATH